MDTTLDITMDTTYQPSTLNQLSAKGGKWYVFVTKPTELQSRPKNKCADLQAQQMKNLLSTNSTRSHKIFMLNLIKH
jgi:hypothetical protein